MGGSFESVGGISSQPSSVEIDATTLYLTDLCYRQARLKVASQLTKLFAFFSVLGAAELNIARGDADENLVLAYVSATSLFVANTVVIKLTVLWVSPQLRLAMLVAQLHPGELEVNLLPLGSLALILDVVWLMATAGGFVLFGVELVLAAWIKFGRFSDSIPLVAVAIMGPTLVVTTSVSILTFCRDRRKLRSRMSV